MIKVVEPIAENVAPYIDAGTGSLIIQVLIASSLGAIVLLKVFWRQVKAFLKKFFSRLRKGDS